MNDSLRQALRLYGKKPNITGGNRPKKNTIPKPTHTKESIIKNIVADHFKRIMKK
jgi:hypothetical protein